MDLFDVRRLLDRWAPLFLLICGVALASLTLAEWGVGDEGVRPAVTGLGKVSVPGASPADVVFLEEHTQRPAVPLLFCGALIVLIAAAMWLHDIVFWTGLIVLGIIFAIASVRTVQVIADPAPRMFDSLVTTELESDMPAMSAGWGAYAALAVCVVALVVSKLTVNVRPEYAVKPNTMM